VTKNGSISRVAVVGALDRVAHSSPASAAVTKCAKASSPCETAKLRRLSAAAVSIVFVMF
jgi:hypothetical protein